MAESTPCPNVKSESGSKGNEDRAVLSVRSARRTVFSEFEKAPAMTTATTTRTRTATPHETNHERRTRESRLRLLGTTLTHVAVSETLAALRARYLLAQHEHVSHPRGLGIYYARYVAALNDYQSALAIADDRSPRRAFAALWNARMIQTARGYTASMAAINSMNSATRVS